MNETSKPVHIQCLYNGPEDWRCLVYRLGVVVCQGRGRTEQHAAQAGAQAFRRWLRTERALNDVRHARQHESGAWFIIDSDGRRGDSHGYGDLNDALRWATNSATAVHPLSTRWVEERGY